MTDLPAGRDLDVPIFMFYLVNTGQCSFCGAQGPVFASNKVDQLTPPGICDECAIAALDLIENG